MTEESPKPDPFKPAQPNIPGVPNRASQSSGRPSGVLATLLQPHAILGFVGTLAFLIGITVWIYSR
ncbi:MAG: hypothetical protein WA734_05005, partial [Candidatus Acidiferrales bacterium]